VASNDPDYGNAYALQVKKGPPAEFIDAQRTSDGFGRWVNSARGTNRQHNSQLVYDARARKANVRATKHIEKGDELLAGYGAEYWRNVEKELRRMVEERASAAASEAPTARRRPAARRRRR
jgi:hypothetical protein